MGASAGNRSYAWLWPLEFARLRRRTSQLLLGAALVGAGGIFTTTAAAAMPERVAFAAIAARHPQDGPHVDLRFRVDRAEFVIEASMNLVFLDWMLDAPREDPERIDESELPGLAERLERYFAQQMPVRIDGVVVPPAIRAVQVNAPDESLLPLFPISGWKGLRKIFFNLAYPLKSAPDEISLAWPAYPPDLLSPLPAKPPLEIATEWTADGLRSSVLFTRAEPGFTWRRPSGELSSRLEKVPTPTAPTPLIPPFATLAIGLFVAAFGAAAIAKRPPIVALGSGLLAAVIVIVVRPTGPTFLAFGTRAPIQLDEAEACRIFTALQTNLYRAFDYEAESSVYDALAQSVDGELLEETYLSVRRALVMEDEGGAMSRVVRVRPIATRVISQGEVMLGEHGEVVRAFTVDATWQVDGRVTHWGHAHDRTNEYEGRFTVAAMSDGWRIHDAEVTRQERVDGGESAQPTPIMPAEDEEL